MLKLNLSRVPFWLDLAHGVRVEVEPVSSTLMLGAREGLGEDTGLAASVSYSKAVGRRAIRAWEGVMDEKGKALPVSDEAVDALFEQSIDCLSAFNKQYVYKGNAVLEEGNGSSPSPSGGSEEEPTTAEAAPDDATPARKSKPAT
jgi:hypothetical protein